MPTLTTPLPHTGFPHEFDSIELAASAPVAVRLTVEARTVLETTLTPSAAGIVSLEDLAPLLRDNAAPGTFSRLRIELDGAVAGEATLMPCRLWCDATADEMLENRFLTTLSGTKVTAPTCREYLSYLAPQDEDLSGCIRATFLRPDGSEILTAVGGTEVVGTDSDDMFHTIDVSPFRIRCPEPGARLIAYTVEIGTRRQHYRLAATPPTASLEFAGAFGFPDTFHFFGTVERELKPSWQTAAMAGRQRTYDVQAVPTHTAMTGLMTEDHLPLLEDLVTATPHALRRDTGETVVVTACDIKTSDDPYSLMEAKVTWRTDRSARRWAPPVGIRTFDETFGGTFR